MMWVYICADCGEEFQNKKKSEYPCELRAHRQGDEEGHPKWSLLVRLLRGDIPVVQEQIYACQKQTRCGHPVSPSGGGELTEDVRGLTTVALGRQDKTGVCQGHVRRGDRFECGDRQTVEEQEDRLQREGTLRFLKEHPNWRTEFSHLNPSIVPPSDLEEEEREEETKAITVGETNDTNIRLEETVTVEMGTPQKRRVP